MSFLGQSFKITNAVPYQMYVYTYMHTQRHTTNISDVFFAYYDTKGNCKEDKEAPFTSN